MYSENCLQRNQGKTKTNLYGKLSVPNVHTSSTCMKRNLSAATKNLVPRGSVIGIIVMIYNFDVAPDCNVNRSIKFVISNAKVR